ncbi:MAG: hypothetical protein V3V14_08335 [Saprospiraceae bacterium]
MLTEINRKDLIEDLHKNINFSYQQYNPDINVFRSGEGFDRKNPYILVEFLPANRKKFRSISDVIGKATEHGQYKQYGYCQIELCSIYCYCGEFVKERSINGRIFTNELAANILKYIMRNWESVLWKMYASFDRSEDIVIRDVSTYNPETGTMVYCYSIDLYLRTQFRWDKIPPEHTEDTVALKAGLFVKSTNEEDYNLLININVEE